jgi:hypothetical protein
MRITRSWGVATAVIAAIVCIAAAALTLTSLAKAQQTPPCIPAATIQWQPGSILEAKFLAHITEDGRAVLNGLQALAKNPGLTPDDMMKYVGTTFLKVPRLWTKTGWIEGWDNVLKELKTIVRPGSQPVITSVSATIEYLPYDGISKPDADIDAVARIRLTFSASPGDNILAGELKHSRVCEII